MGLNHGLSNISGAPTDKNVINNLINELIRIN